MGADVASTGLEAIGCFSAETAGAGSGRVVPISFVPKPGRRTVSPVEETRDARLLRAFGCALAAC